MAAYDFIEAIPSEIEPGMWWAVVEGRDGIPDIIDDAYETKAEAEKAGRSYKTDMRDGERADRHAWAMEEGCLQGIDAYNEIMGWD